MDEQKKQEIREAFIEKVKTSGLNLERDDVFDLYNGIADYWLSILEQELAEEHKLALENMFSEDEVVVQENKAFDAGKSHGIEIGCKEGILAERTRLRGEVANWRNEILTVPQGMDVKSYTFGYADTVTKFLTLLAD